ncbi:MAG: hypothetical protein CMO01_04215 [Thalassobius sp.]|nr:hypothetical protein [Thalassovita sp.]
MSELDNEHSEIQNNNQGDTQKTEKKSASKNKRLRWFSSFLGVLLIIAVSLQLIFKYYSDDIIKRLLKEAVALKSDGLYQLDFEKGSFSLFTQEFYISNLTFKLNEQRLEQLRVRGKEYKLLYELSIPEIEMKAGSLKDAWFKKTWRIEDFHIIKPNVKLKADTQVARKVEQAENTNDLFFLISGYLNLFRVEHFILEHANISYTDTSAVEYALNDINLEINGFQVDSTSQMVDGKPFYVDDIQCTLGKNEMKLQKQGYQINFEKVQASVSGEKLFLQGLRVLPLDQDSLLSRTMNFHLEEVTMEGLDYSMAYFDSVIIAKSILINKPFVDARVLKTNNLNAGNKASFTYESIGKFIKSFTVGEVNFDSASLYFNIPGMDIEVENFSLNLDNVWFDKDSWDDRKDRFFADDFELLLRNYVADLPDRIHRLQALEMGISSNRRYAYCNNVLISPRNEHITTKELNKLGKDKLMNFYLSRVEFTGLDIWNAYLNKTLNVSTFRVNRPRLEVNHFVNLAQRIALQDKLDSIQKIKLEAFPDTIATQDIFEYDSTATEELVPETIDSVIVVSDSLVLADIQEIQERFPGANDVPITEGDTTLKNVSFTSYLLDYYDSLEQLTEDSLKLLTVQDSLQQIDRDSLLKEEVYQQVKSVFRYVNINTVDINEAHFNYTECQADTVDRILMEDTFVELEKFRLSPDLHSDSSAIFFSQKVEIRSKKLAYYLPDSIHYVAINDLIISSEDSLIRAGETWYTPANRNRNFIVDNIDDVKTIFDIRLKGFELGGLNFNEMSRDQKYEIDYFNIEKPNIFHFVSSKNKQDSALAKQEINPTEIIELNEENLYKWTPKLHDYIQKFNIAAVSVSDGFYSLARVTERTREVISARNIEICVKDFELDSTELLADHVLPLTGDVEVLAQNYFINLPDSIHILEAKSLGISMSSESFYVYNILIQPSAIGKRDKDANKYNVAIPEFRLDGVDWERLYIDKELYVRELLVNNPTMDLKTMQKQAGAGEKIDDSQQATEDKPGFKPEMLYDAALKVFKVVEIKRMNLNRGNLNWEQIAGNTINQNVKTNRLDIALSDFRIDSLEGIRDDRFLFSTDVQVNVKNYIHRLPDKWHSIRASEIGYSSSAQEFYGTFVHYAPKNWADFNFMEANPERKNLMDIYTPEFTLEGFDLGKVLFENTLKVDEITLDKPKFRVVLHPKGEAPPPEERFSTIKLDSTLNKMFNGIEIGKFEFEDAEIEIGVHPLGKESTYFNFDRLFTNVKNLNTLVEDEGHTRFMLSDDIHIGLKDYELDMPDSIYKFKASELGISTGRNLLYVNNLDFKPRIAKNTIAELFGHEIDWMHFKINRVELENFNFDEFLARDAVVADQFNIDRLDAYVYRDKRPPERFGHRPQMPQQFLRNMQTYVKLDTVNLYNSKLTYEELASDGKAPGQLYFENLNAYAFNITNDTALINNGAAVQLFTNAFLMGEGRIEAAFLIPIGNENNSFTFQGSLEPMDLRAINPMLENVAGLKVNSGMLRRLSFEVQADEEYADGIMRFYYKDLNVALLKRDAKPKKEGKIKSLLTMFANVLVKSKNPRFLFLKRGKIYAERDKSKSIFNYWAKTLLSGVKHSVGFSNEKPPKDRRKTVFQFWKRRRKDFRRKKER